MTSTVRTPMVLTLRCQRYGDVPVRLDGQQHLDAIGVSSASRVLMAPPAD